MFMGVTFVTPGKNNAEADKELRAIINTNNIKLLAENTEHPNTCVVTFLDDTPSGLIKGSYEEMSKILYGFNRKLNS